MNAGVRASPAARSLDKFRRTRVPFFFFSIYLLSQCFTIPVLAVGPSWAVWPTLSDLAIAALAVSAVALWRARTTPPGANATTFRWLRYLALGCLASYLLFTVGGLSNLDLPPAFRRGTGVGLFQLYRLAQGLLLFWVASRIPLSPRRVRILTRVVTTALVLTIAGVCVTFLEWIDPAVFAGHLDPSFQVSGPWASYFLVEGEGLGTIGYNHGYVAVQLLLLLMVRLHLQPLRIGANLGLLACVVLCCFFSGSRSGLAAAMLFALILLVKNPTVGLLAGLFVGTLILWILARWLVVEPVVAMAERQVDLLDPMNPASLAGRDELWSAALEFLDRVPIRWLTGTGFGAAADGPGNAHLLYLHIVLETGLLGLAAFAGVAAAVLRKLRRLEAPPRPMFWGIVALLFSSLTQETLYPVPAFGGFVPFLCAALALAFVVSESRVARAPSTPRARARP